MASTNSNHRLAAILHMTRSTIKYNMADKVSKLVNRHKSHGEARDMGNGRDREGTSGKVTNGGYRERGVVSNANRVICGGGQQHMREVASGVI